MLQIQESIDSAAALVADSVGGFDWADSPLVGGLVAWLEAHPLLAAGGGLVVVGLLSWLAFLLVRRHLLRILAGLARRTPSPWDQALFDRTVFDRLSWAVPLLLLHTGVQFVPHLGASLTDLIQRLATACLVLVSVRSFGALLTALNAIYIRYPLAKDRPIKGFLQVTNVVAHLVAVILIIATLVDRSPLVFFSGLGAMTAILLLVFRDTLLSLVAGVQITSNGHIRVGDWIEMPQFGADGDVVDIALNTVSVQNWDRTITVIPTHKFLENSFKNWRGMRDAGGRRIKRSLYVDMSTIRFLREEEIERLGRFVLLRDYIARKRAELEEYNRLHSPDPGFTANARRLTNIGTLRAYIDSYLRQHPGIHQEMTFLVRQLQPTAQGLPLEIYVFTNDTRWAYYEGIQSDIFDHILSIIPEFGLRVYQQPSGHDVAELAGLFDQQKLQPA